MTTVLAMFRNPVFIGSGFAAEPAPDLIRGGAPE